MKMIVDLRYACGITESEFWDTLTPIQAFKYLVRREESEERQDYRMGTLIMNILGLFKSQKGHPYKFWPWHESHFKKANGSKGNNLRENLRSRAAHQKKKGG